MSRSAIVERMIDTPIEDQVSLSILLISYLLVKLPHKLKATKITRPFLLYINFLIDILATCVEYQAKCCIN